MIFSEKNVTYDRLKKQGFTFSLEIYTSKNHWRLGFKSAPSLSPIDSTLLKAKAFRTIYEMERKHSHRITKNSPTNVLSTFSVMTTYL